MCKKISINKEIKMKRKGTLHGKPGHVSEKSNFNSDSESDPSDGDDTEHLIKYDNFDDEMVSFDKKNGQFLQKLHYHKNVLKFVLSLISILYSNIYAMKNKVHDIPSNTKWYLSTGFPFKKLIEKNQYWLALRHMKK